MGKLRNWILAGVCLMLCVSLARLLADKEKLSNEVIRLHVVANSDSDYDQNIKLQVRDSVIDYLQSEMDHVSDADQARACIREKIPQLTAVANHTLRTLGVEGDARVQFCREEFPVRYYESFTLPAGVYDSLRITIGAGEGRNWWCVVFPTLCFAATAENLEAVAAGAGFSEELTGSITGEYELRFFLLDALGRLENMFHR